MLMFARRIDAVLFGDRSQHIVTMTLWCVMLGILAVVVIAQLGLWIRG